MNLAVKNRIYSSLNKNSNILVKKYAYWNTTNRLSIDKTVFGLQIYGHYPGNNIDYMIKTDNIHRPDNNLISIIHFDALFNNNLPYYLQLNYTDMRSRLYPIRLYTVDRTVYLPVYNNLDNLDNISIKIVDKNKDNINFTLLSDIYYRE